VIIGMPACWHSVRRERVGDATLADDRDDLVAVDELLDDEGGLIGRALISSWIATTCGP